MVRARPLRGGGAALWTYLRATARGSDSASRYLVLVLGDIQAMIEKVLARSSLFVFGVATAKVLRATPSR